MRAACVLGFACCLLPRIDGLAIGGPKKDSTRLARGAGGGTGASRERNLRHRGHPMAEPSFGEARSLAAIRRRSDERQASIRSVAMSGDTKRARKSSVRTVHGKICGRIFTTSF